VNGTAANRRVRHEPEPSTQQRRHERPPSHAGTAPAAGMDDHVTQLIRFDARVRAQAQVSARAGS
jgi:hypothetical protein